MGECRVKYTYASENSNIRSDDDDGMSRFQVIHVSHHLEHTEKKKVQNDEKHGSHTKFRFKSFFDVFKGGNVQ